MITTKTGQKKNLNLTNFLRTVKPGDELQRWDSTRNEWFVSFTIATEEHVARAFRILKDEGRSARVFRPAVIVATGDY